VRRSGPLYLVKVVSRAPPLESGISLQSAGAKSLARPAKRAPPREQRRRAANEAGLHIVVGGNIDFHKDDEADIRHKFEYGMVRSYALYAACSQD
jgi:hypothetical protein